ncbi:helix-turn-helix transcriptional regulator [uncultured Pontibacter sp.]|uniref:helix-turn-helix domain-containing protein n=1 Tax=uncultured Pontibacter sp. TaxID=453356 RepID=UPI00261E1F27|nr:helix-turn-helix transcriptional regulator [uncultured Pontibacter sp.]
MTDSKINVEPKAKKYFSLDEVEDNLFGEKGTETRDAYEAELKIELAGEMIKKLRKAQHLTQTELGEKIGVQKAQISKLEKSTGSVSLETFARVIGALGAKLKVEAPSSELELC